MTILGCGDTPHLRLAGRKRRRGACDWDYMSTLPSRRRLANAIVLDSIPEEEEEDAVNADDVDVEMESAAPDSSLETECEDEVEARVRTVVFGPGAGGSIHVGYVFCAISRGE